MQTSQPVVSPAAFARSLVERRRFVKRLGLFGAAAAGVGTVGFGTRSAQAALPVTFEPIGGGSRRTVVDTDIINFAMNLEYLGSEFYQIAAYGTRMPSNLTSGTGTRGTVTGGRLNDAFAANPNSQVAQFARELARDEYGHLEALRGLAGRKSIAEPDVNIGSAWTNLAIAAGIITTGQTFDPYLNETNFLLAAFVLEDVCVTAVIGGSVYVRNEVVLAALSSALGTEGYHGGAIRSMLFGLGQTNPAVLTNAAKFSNLRDASDNPNDEMDQPLTDKNGQANVVPTDVNGLAFSRTFQEVLNIAYLGNPNGGGFFPNRVNGNIR